MKYFLEVKFKCFFNRKLLFVWALWKSHRKYVIPKKALKKRISRIFLNYISFLSEEFMSEIHTKRIMLSFIIDLSHILRISLFFKDI